MKPLMIFVALFYVSVAQGQRVEFNFQSKTLNESHNIWVQFPEGYDKNNSYGVIYVLDADGHFEYVSQYVDYLSKPFANLIPKLIVVGIRSKSPAFRFQYFTPKTNQLKEGEGKADQFLNFIANELAAEISRRYKTTPTRVLAGHSLAGLFALYAMQKAPGKFTHVIAASPSLGYLGTDGFNQLVEALSSQTETPIYFSVADNDMKDYQQFTDDLSTKLKGSGRVKWKYDVINGTDHYSTAPAAFYNGLIMIFK